MRSSTTFIAFALLSCFACCTTTAQRTTYHFTQKSLNDSYNELCFADAIDYTSYIGNTAEAQVLDFTFPITGKEENEIGSKVHQNHTYTYVEDSRTLHLRNLLANMQPHIQRKDITYQIFLIEDPVINAWTIPGGYIYVTTGILAATNTDDELAMIVGHEIGHNEAHHTKRFIQRNAPATLFGDAYSIGVALMNVAVISFGQPQEMEADRYGLYLSYQAGYNPLMGLQFWERMAQKEQPTVLEKMFRSHPYSAERNACGKHYLDTYKD